MTTTTLSNDKKTDSIPTKSARTGQRIIINAYDERHPEHEEMVRTECDQGLDISLLPTFEVEIEVADEELGNDTQSPT